MSVHNNPELFTQQIAGIVMVFTLVKLNDGFMIAKPNTEHRVGHKVPGVVVWPLLLK